VIHKTFLLLLSLLLINSWSCKTQQLVQPPLPDNYTQQIEEWRSARMAGLLAPTGWLSLIGLHWLQEGVNECGSKEGVRVPLPGNAPAVAVTYTLNDGQVSCDPNTSAGVTMLSANNCQLEYQSLQWQLLERGGRHGVRIRDTLLPSRIRLAPIEYFPINPAYRVYAAWEPNNGPDSVLMRNVLDMEYYVPVVGKLRFTLDDRLHELTALDGGPNDLFLIFADKTTGETTYGGGRYLYCSRAGADGRTIIDFNKAYNPPCAFTEFATCLLPRVENTLPITILAGEKNYGGH
jgi:uncharacterized protein (DUF1684 family)